MITSLEAANGLGMLNGDPMAIERKNQMLNNALQSYHSRRSDVDDG